MFGLGESKRKGMGKITEKKREGKAKRNNILFDVWLLLYKIMNKIWVKVVKGAISVVSLS